jgi:uncharacterized protein YqgC (DUF456 family)
MDLIWTVVAVVLMMAGLIGCIVPLLPGPPLSYVALLVLQLRESPPFTWRFLLIWLFITIVVQVLDYVFPILATKKFGGTRYGVWGCVLGLIAGFWFGPVGIITGPFIGAFAGEWLYSENSEQAMRAAIGSFIGFLFSTLLKLIVSGLMMWYMVKALWL